MLPDHHYYKIIITMQGNRSHTQSIQKSLNNYENKLLSIRLQFMACNIKRSFYKCLFKKVRIFDFQVLINTFKSFK